LISKKGIRIEIGLNSFKSAENFTKSNLEGDFLRILLEPPEQVLKMALETIDQIENHFINQKIKLPFLLHGFNKTCWDLLELAFIKNYEARIGFEDTLTLPNGKSAKSNIELIEEAQRIK
ncbi:3-keto-5-aminohexanoate cleavage protein, partial [Salinimicrobium oceani]